jgi:hypothetical protein
VTWLALLASGGPSTNPVASATSDLVTYILGYGVLGVAVIAFAFRLIVPAKALNDARRDLERENARLITERDKAEAERDAALKIAQDQLVPLLVSFTAASQSLLPLLQDLVAMREGGRERNPPGRSGRG